jgi:hypothetical protein
VTNARAFHAAFIESEDRVVVVTIQDAHSSAAPTPRGVSARTLPPFVPTNTLDLDDCASLGSSACEGGLRRSVIDCDRRRWRLDLTITPSCCRGEPPGAVD